MSRLNIILALGLLALRTGPALADSAAPGADAASPAVLSTTAADASAVTAVPNAISPQADAAAAIGLTPTPVDATPTAEAASVPAAAGSVPVQPAADSSTAAADLTATPGSQTAEAGALTQTSAAAAWTAVDGPAHLTLSTEVLLELPAGWRFVAKDQLPAYFASTKRNAGDWDLGVALGPDDGAPELRLQFEPVGAVDDSAGLEEPLALLDRVQQMAEAENSTHEGQGSAQITVWNQPPAYELGAHRLLFGETRTENGQDLAAWRLRLPGRSGVLKLDLVAPADTLPALSAQAAVLAAGLSFQENRGLDSRQSTDRAAALDLNGLVLEGVLGRSDDGGSGKAPVSAWVWITLCSVTALALALGGALLWRRLGPVAAAPARPELGDAGDGEAPLEITEGGEVTEGGEPEGAKEASGGGQDAGEGPEHDPGRKPEPGNGEKEIPEEDGKP
jgi:uncharacterized membrane-anchored protein